MTATLRRFPLPLLLVALGLATGGVLLMAWLAGFGGFDAVLPRFTPRWVSVALGGQLLAYGGYLAAYRSVVHLDQGPRISLPTSARLVVAGFGSFDPGGGFGMDRRALECIHGQRRAATVRILALGGVEYVVIAPIACVIAIVLLVQGSVVQSAVLWPWAVAVPVGFGIGFPIAARRGRLLAGRSGRGWEVLDHALEGIGYVPRLLRRPGHGLAAFGGCALYWTGEVVSLWGSLRCFGANLPVGALVLALATGYALTRRSMPLGGAGVTEILMSYALLWCGIPLAVAVPAVVVYRFCSLAVPMVPGLWARRDIAHLVGPTLRPRPADPRGPTADYPPPG